MMCLMFGLVKMGLLSVIQDYSDYSTIPTRILKWSFFPCLRRFLFNGSLQFHTISERGPTYLRLAKCQDRSPHSFPSLRGWVLWASTAPGSVESVERVDFRLRGSPWRCPPPAQLTHQLCRASFYHASWGLGD